MLQEFIVGKGESDPRLQVFVRQRLGNGVSQRAVKRLLDLGKCRLNGKIERHGTVNVRGGDRVQLVIEEACKPKVVFEDESIVVVNKPPGLIAVDVAERYGQAVHRLDRDTSGLLLVAKTDEAREALELLFRERKIFKRYIALVNGRPRGDRGEIDNYLDGKSAQTSWEVIGAGSHYSLIGCAPKTGRTHQIRKHLAGLGCPIIGDTKYGSRTAPRGVTHHLLHAERLVFESPFTGKTLRFEAPTPKIFEELCKS